MYGNILLSTFTAIIAKWYYTMICITFIFRTSGIYPLKIARPTSLHLYDLTIYESTRSGICKSWEFTMVILANVLKKNTHVINIVSSSHHNFVEYVHTCAYEIYTVSFKFETTDKAALEISSTGWKWDDGTLHLVSRKQTSILSIKF